MRGILSVLKVSGELECTTAAATLRPTSLAVSEANYNPKCIQEK